MPTKKGTGKAQTPSKAKRVIKIKRKTSSTVKAKPKKSQTKKIVSKTKRASKAGVYSFTGVDGKEYSLSIQQYNFANLMIDLQTSPFQAVIDAGYKVTDDKGKLNKNVVWATASRLLSKVKIQQYINKQLESVRLNKEVAMLELAQLVLQKYDNKTKTKALDMYFKLIGEYAPEKHQHSMDAEISEALGKVASLVK